MYLSICNCKWRSHTKEKSLEITFYCHAAFYSLPTYPSNYSIDSQVPRPALNNLASPAFALKPAFLGGCLSGLETLEKFPPVHVGVRVILQHTRRKPRIIFFAISGSLKLSQVVEKLALRPTQPEGFKVNVLRKSIKCCNSDFLSTGPVSSASQPLSRNLASNSIYILIAIDRWFGGLAKLSAAVDSQEGLAPPLNINHAGSGR